jgi:hypothetical protein
VRRWRATKHENSQTGRKSFIFYMPSSARWVPPAPALSRQTPSATPASALEFVSRLRVPLMPPMRLNLFLNAALRNLLSHSEQMGWLVGAVGIELLSNFTKSRVFTVLPTASQMNWS